MAAEVERPPYSAFAVAAHNALALKTRNRYTFGQRWTIRLIRISLIAAFFATFGLPASALETATDAAKTADLSFLKLVDSAQYGQSWRVTAAIFQTQVTQAQWQQAMATVRAPLGTLAERKLQDATFTQTLPGAPDGNYVVAHFQTSFEKKRSAVETVVTSREKDGAWHVSGYFIK